MPKKQPRDEAPAEKLPLGALITAFLAIGTGIVAMASFEFLVIPMQTDLGFSSDNANALAFLPQAASLLVVFLAGAFADRVGARAVMVVGAAIFTTGALVVGLAGGVGAVTIGRVLDGLGGSIMGIVGLSVINATVVEPKARAKVFGVFAALVPAMFFLIPPLAAIVVESTSWRVVTGGWAALGLITIAAAAKYAGVAAASQKRELLTPVLAGLALAGLAMGITNIPNGWQVALPLFAIGIVAAIAVPLALRRIAAPSLELRWLRKPGAGLLVAGMVAAAIPNLFFYTNLLLQYRYAVSGWVIAGLLMIPQAFAVAGGLLSGPISSRLGAPRTAALALLTAAGTSLTGLLVAGDAPIWIPVAVLALSAAPIAASVGPLTETFLNQAPRELSGVASSARNGIWTLGACIGGAIFGALAFNSFQGRMASILTDAGQTSEQANVIAEQIRGGAVVNQLVATIPDEATRELLVGQASGLLAAQSFAYWVVCVASSVIFASGAALVFAYMRRSAKVSAA